MRRHQLSLLPLLILTDPRFGDIIQSYLPQAAPDVPFLTAHDLPSLRQLLADPGQLRLVGFMTDCIVPADLIGRQALPDYNIHPGTPDYPGSYPEIRAAHDKASVFGATLHEMAQKIDSGSIIAVESQSVDEHTITALGLIGFECAFTLLGIYAPKIAGASVPLASSGQHWCGEFMTKAQAMTLKAKYNLS